MQVLNKPTTHYILGASLLPLLVKNPPAKEEDTGSIPMSGRSPGGGHGNPLQYSCLENPMDRGVWWATVHRVPNSWTRLKRLGTHAHVYIHVCVCVCVCVCVIEYYAAIKRTKFCHLQQHG